MNLRENPLLECSWENTLPVYNSTQERIRAKQTNRNLFRAPYPLTREYLNNYFNTTKFNFSNYDSFIYDCAASMYSYFLMSFGFEPSTATGGNGALPAMPGGEGISYGFNKWFGVIDIDSPILWILLAVAGAVVIKKVID